MKDISRKCILKIIKYPVGCGFFHTSPGKQEKFCVVYDGSAEFEHHSINSEIFPGHYLLVTLFDVITRFRMGKYAIIGDLKECFFQIGIPPQQRDFFCILWYAEDDINRELEIWRFAVHL